MYSGYNCGVAAVCYRLEKAILILLYTVIYLYKVPNDIVHS